MTEVRRRRRGHLGAPVVGAAVTGVLAYVVFALTTRTLGSEAAAPVSVLWSYWTLAGAAFTFPIQHWVTRTVAAEGEAEVRASLPRVGAAVFVLAAGSGVVAYVLRDPLFHQGSATWPGLVALVSLGATLMGLVRGGLAGRHRFVALGWSLVLENLVRCVAIGVLAIAGVRDAGWYGASLVLGYVTVVMWSPAMRFARVVGHRPAGGPLRSLSGTAGGQLLGQVVLTSGPVLLALLHGDPAKVTALFAALALFRAPYVLGLGAVAPLTGWLTRHVIAQRTDVLRRFRIGAVVGTVVGGVLAAGFGAVAGPLLLRLVFGSDVRLGGGACAVVAVASLIALANLVVAISAIAQDRSRVLVTVWVAAVVAAAAAVMWWPAGDLHRVVWAFFLAELVAFVGLVADDHWASRGRGELRP